MNYAFEVWKMGESSLRNIRFHDKLLTYLKMKVVITVKNHEIPSLLVMKEKGH